jgi:AhpD family alkylhydroperoxidase
VDGQLTIVTLDSVAAPRTITAPAAVSEALGLAGRSGALIAIWGRRRLDPRLREEVMLAVAQANECRWCSLAHRRWALAEGITDDELAAIDGQDPERFDRRTWTAIAWAQARTRADLEPVPEELDAALARHYGEDERADLDLVTQVMGLANRSANTFDALLARLRGRPQPGSRLRDELALGSIVALSIPPVALYLGLRRLTAPAGRRSGAASDLRD